jgi:N-acetylglutamate synthase-like GNAT family acetyltransferase
MAEKVHFVPVDLRIHRSKVVDLNVEYMNWWLKGIEECFKTDLATLLGWSKKAVENKKREYLTSEVEKLCLDPHGIYYLLELEDAVIGMGALHQLRKNLGELKRMYIRPAYRGKGYGKALLQQLLQKAKELGYHSVYLDSGRFMTTAHDLYRYFGFIERKEYPETEIPPQLRPQWLFMEKTLKDTAK